MSDNVTKHPAYGFIRLHRASGGNGTLFMSPLRHDNRITITIGEAEQVRSLNCDTFYADKELVSVDMSEQQFAQFVCNANSHSGAPCTIRRSESGSRPPLEAQQLKSERYYSEAQETVAEALKQIDELKTKIASLTGKLPKKTQDEINSVIDSAHRKLNDHVPWIVQQIHEHMDKVTQAAKIEIEAYAVRATDLTGTYEYPRLESGNKDE